MKTTESSAMPLSARKTACVLLMLFMATILFVKGAAGRVGTQSAQTPAPFDPTRTFSLEDLKADLQVLRDVLEEGHGGFERYAQAAELRKEFDAVRDSLKGPLTRFDFFTRLLPLVAGIKDGHTRLSLPPPPDAYLDSRPIIFPLGLRVIGDKAYILRDLTPDRGVGEGAELLAIDGRPFRSVLAALLPLVPADAGILTAKLRRLEPPASFSRLYGLLFGWGESFRIKFLPFKGVAAREISVPGLTAADLGRLRRERYPETDVVRPAYELSFRGATAVLTIRQFGDDPDKTRPRFPDFLTKTFLTLEEKKTPGLVIDLRGNGGGFDEYGKFLFAHIMDRPFLYYWALETKKDRYDLFRYTDETPASADELAKPLQKNARGWFDVLGHPNRGLQSTRKPRFAGRVAILIDGGSFSATGETTSAFHYYKKAVFFGEEGGAGYYGNTSGFMVTVVLPHSRIEVRVPLVLYTMAVDGYPRDRGLVPDFPVTPTIGDLLAGRDPVLDRALAYLAKK
jgi:hypothetical protein